MGEFRAACLFYFGAQLLARRIQSRSVYFAYDKKVRNGRPTLRGAFGHQARNRAAAIGRRGRRRTSGFCGGENIRSKNFSAGGRTAHISEIDTSFGG